MVVLHQQNEWVRHVCLQPDGCSDPPGIRVRPVPGKDGCAYLSPGALTNNLSYVRSSASW
jgi:hypothetical protein